jgi:hypothetical protein
MTSIQRNSVIVFFLAIAVRMVFHSLTSFTADDAFITFRYADNIAAGHGFVYNLGQHVLGTSTPLFTFILSTLSVLSVKPVVAALMIGLLCSGATAVVMYRLAHVLRFGDWSFLPALLFILWPRSIVTDTCGMETALFGLMTVAAVYYHHRRLEYYALAAATLAAVTRYEGFLLLALLLAAVFWRDRRHFWSYLIAPAVIILPWLLFAFVYFGSIIPHSVTAKLALYARFAYESPWENLKYMMAWHNPLGWAMFAAAVWGGFWMHRKQLFGRLEALWMIGMVLFYTFSRTHLFFWYPSPLYPVYLLFAAAAAVALTDLGAVRKINAAPLRYVVAVAAISVLAWGNRPKILSFGSQQETLQTVHREIGNYLFGHGEPADVVAAEDIGYMGYYSQLNIIDRDGLVSPEAVPYNRAGQYFELINDFRPEWVVAYSGSPLSAFITEDRFLKLYHLEKSFVSVTNIQYLLFRKANSDGAAS